MPFPESPRVVYTKNPLAEVICQLRFPPVLRISSGQVADYQERIRSEYPLYSLEEPAIDLPVLRQELPSILQRFGLLISGTTSHKFSTKDSQRFIALAQDFLALRESSYEKWENFRQEIKIAETALREVYEPAFYSRVGLRYKDVISRSRLGLEQAAWKDLLQPHIVAALSVPEVSEAIVSIQTQSLISTPEVPGGQVRLMHGLVRPPPDGEECYMIDADFHIEVKEGLHEPFDVLDKFNRLAGRLFRWAITDRLHESMGPRPI